MGKVSFEDALASGVLDPSAPSIITASLTMHNEWGEVLYAPEVSMRVVDDVPRVTFPPVVDIGQRGPRASIPVRGLTTRPSGPKVAMMNYHWLQGLGPGVVQPFAWNEVECIDLTLVAPNARHWPAPTGIGLELELLDSTRTVVAQARMGLQEAGPLLHAVGPCLYEPDAAANYTINLEINR